MRLKREQFQSLGVILTCAIKPIGFGSFEQVCTPKPPCRLRKCGQQNVIISRHMTCGKMPHSGRGGVAGMRQFRREGKVRKGDYPLLTPYIRDTSVPESEWSLSIHQRVRTCGDCKFQFQGPVDSFASVWKRGIESFLLYMHQACHLSRSRLWLISSRYYGAVPFSSDSST